MKSIQRILSLLILMLFTLLAVSCAPSATAVSASAPEPTATATPAPTATPTVIETETPVPTLDQTEVLAQEKQDFIEKTGEYSYENIENKLFITGSPREDLNKTYDLGVVQFFEGVNWTQILVQGWLYSYREENGNLILEVGFDNKDGNKRLFEDITVPIDFYQKYPSDRMGLYFLDYKYYQMADSDLTDLGSKSDMESIKNQLNDVIDEPMIFTFYSRYVITDKEKNVFGEEAALALGNLLNDNSSAINLLLSEISNNGENVKVDNIDDKGSTKLILTDVRACFE